MEGPPKQALLDSLKLKGYSDLIVNAFNKIKREDFVPPNVSSFAYEDIPLPVDDGSTTSQPSTIAFMLSLLDLKQNQKILEIGSGSGYVLALMSDIIKNGKIYGVELNKNLAIKSKKLLINNSNIEIISRSGELGLPEFAPYDRILISASCPDLRIPTILLDQLQDQGIMVAAVKQSICQFKKENNKIEKKEFPGFAFVPFKTGY